MKILKKQRRFVSEFLAPGQEPGLRVHGNVPPAQPESCPLSRIQASAMTFSLRKEVIQPQVLLRLPCYDFTPIMNYTLEGCPLAVGAPASSATHFRDVTGGVYKARERIHRGILIRDY
jgi:hypothetical protein